MTSTEAPDVLLRRAETEDAAAVAEVHLRARAAAPMPPSVHDAEDVQRWVAQRAAEVELWVAERDGSVVAYADLEREGDGPGWLHSLYVLPDHARQGVGSLLLDLAKARRPAGFSLWVFESNTPARAFYARHGLVELERTDGRTNEERHPDVRMAWPGDRPLDHFRAQIDQVDAELALLLAHRFALTRAVQGFKPVGGHEGRDPEREAEIVRGMAARAPGVPTETWRRVVDAVIAAGLDASEKSTTIASYQRDAAGYAAGITPDITGELADLMDAFAARLPPAAQVLEIGSGSGRDALALEERGLTVRRTDITPAFVQLIQETGHPSDVIDPLLDDLGGPYDAVWANAVLLHVARADVPTVLARLRAATRPGGTLALTLKEGDGDAWSTHGSITGARHFTYWREDPLRQALEQSGWTIESLTSSVAFNGQSWLLTLASAR